MASMFLPQAEHRQLQFAEADVLKSFDVYSGENLSVFFRAYV